MISTTEYLLSLTNDPPKNIRGDFLPNFKREIQALHPDDILKPVRAVVDGPNSHIQLQSCRLQAPETDSELAPTAKIDSRLIKLFWQMAVHTPSCCTALCCVAEAVYTLLLTIMGG